ncbi:MAG: response regulator [Chloroflexi bacterium]|nr:response regulator [Chloroflexota bacterium]
MRRIKEGIYPPGSRLPGGAGLALEFGVALMTVRQALDALVDKGYIVRKQGKGTFVVSPVGRKRVLVADDDPGLRELLNDIITGEGYEVVAVEDGEGAVAAVAGDGGFALAFLDIRMPRIGGLEAMMEMKKLSPQTVVVIVTGYAEDLALLDRSQVWPLTVIRKPFHIQQVIDALRLVGRREV